MLASVLVAATLLFAGCATQAPAPTAPAEPKGYPSRDYQQALAEGKAVLRVDPTSSTAVIEVRRAGSLARLGHDHVVAVHDLRGYAWPEAGRADLYVALDALVVDESKLREQAGFDTQPTPDAIAGTRLNMMNRVLETGQFPFALIHVDGLDRQGVAAVSITLHGTTRTMSIPLNVEAKPDEWVVSGAFSINQSDFGIVPMSLLGGAIQVRDAVDIRFDTRASRP
jgi:hypothetical protein